MYINGLGDLFGLSVERKYVCTVTFQFSYIFEIAIKSNERLRIFQELAHQIISQIQLN